MSKDEKLKALNLALSQIEKDFGKEAIMRLGDTNNENVEAIPTGALPLDIAIGIGGIPRGRIIEIYGPESSGKSTLAMCIAAQAQKQGGIVAYIDAEHAMDPDYAGKLGVNVDDMLISQPDSGEQGLAIAEKLVCSGAVDLIVVDSVAALVPRAEIEGEMGDSFVGIQARLMSQGLRKLTPIVAKSKASIIFINQLRQKIGVMWGNPETTPGGLALKFYSSVRLDIRRVEAIKKGDEVLGNRVRVKVVKNKVSAPFKQAEFDIVFGKGIDKIGYIVDIGVEDGIIEKAGSFFTYKEERFQGKDKFKEYLLNTPEIALEIENLIREKHNCKSLAKENTNTETKETKEAKETKEKEEKKEKKTKK